MSDLKQLFVSPVPQEKGGKGAAEVKAERKEST